MEGHEAALDIGFIFVEHMCTREIAASANLKDALPKPMDEPSTTCVNSVLLQPMLLAGEHAFLSRSMLATVGPTSSNKQGYPDIADVLPSTVMKKSRKAQMPPRSGISDLPQ